MGFVAAPGIIGVQAIWNQDNQNIENTHYLKPTVAINSALLGTIATTYAAWAATILSHVPNNCELIEIYVRDLSSQFSFSLSSAVNPPLVGSASGTPLPNHVTIAFKRQTGLAGRKNRGRIYWVGVTTSETNGSDQMSAASANGKITLLSNLLTAWSGISCPEVILHRSTGTSTPVLNWTYSDLILDSQRRRLPGHNRHH